MVIKRLILVGSAEICFVGIGYTNEHKIHVNFGSAIPEPEICGVAKLNGNGYRTFNIGRIRLKFVLWVLGTLTNTKYMSISVRRFRKRRFAGSRS